VTFVRAKYSVDFTLVKTNTTFRGAGKIKEGEHHNRIASVVFYDMLVVVVASFQMIGLVLLAYFGGTPSANVSSVLVAFILAIPFLFYFFMFILVIRSWIRVVFAEKLGPVARRRIIFGLKVVAVVGSLAVIGVIVGSFASQNAEPLNTIAASGVLWENCIFPNFAQFLRFSIIRAITQPPFPVKVNNGEG